MFLHFCFKKFWIKLGIFLFSELVKKDSTLPNFKRLKSFDDFSVSNKMEHVEPSTTSFKSLVSDQYNSGSSSEWTCTRPKILGDDFILAAHAEELIDFSAEVRVSPGIASEEDIFYIHYMKITFLYLNNFRILYIYKCKQGSD